MQEGKGARACGVLALAATLMACGGQVSSEGAPGGGSGASGTSGNGGGTGGGAASASDPTSPVFLASIGAGYGCLPAPLALQSTGLTNCALLEVLPGEGPPAACRGIPGLSIASSRLTDALHAERLDIDPRFPVCTLDELGPRSWSGGASCSGAIGAGWCYVDGAAAAPCAQAIRFSPGGNPTVGALLLLACQ